MWIPLGLLGRPIRDVACGFGRTKATTPEHSSIDLKSRIPLSGAILSCQLWVTKHILGRFSAQNWRILRIYIKSAHPPWRWPLGLLLLQ